MHQHAAFHPLQIKSVSKTVPKTVAEAPKNYPSQHRHANRDKPLDSLPARGRIAYTLPVHSGISFC
jgi:hypothetical protein